MLEILNHLMEVKKMPRPKKGWGAKFVPTTKVKEMEYLKGYLLMRRYDWRISPSIKVGKRYSS